MRKLRPAFLSGRHSSRQTHTDISTVRAGFVDEVAEVEQGGPGSQVLNESLRTRQRRQRTAKGTEREESLHTR